MPVQGGRTQGVEVGHHSLGVEGPAWGAGEELSQHSMGRVPALGGLLHVPQGLLVLDTAQAYWPAQNRSGLIEDFK